MSGSLQAVELEVLYFISSLCWVKFEALAYTTRMAVRSDFDESGQLRLCVGRSARFFCTKGPKFASLQTAARVIMAVSKRFHRCIEHFVVA